MYTGQSDVADAIVSRHRNFLYSAQHSHNVVVRNLATAMLLYILRIIVLFCLLYISVSCLYLPCIFGE